MPLDDVLSRQQGVRERVDRGQVRTAALMGVVVLGLHALGFFLLLVVAVHHHRLGAGGLAVGTGVTAYTLGLRHAFDADHISAIDNTTRKLMAEGKRPLSVGFWFSLGHSTIVFALALLISVGVRAIDGPVKNDNSSLHQVTNWIGALVSGSFLYVIAAINVVILLGVIKVFREMRTSRYDEAELEEQLQKRGLMNRILGRLTQIVTKPAQMYPIGVLFGLGFDTATEVALLVLAGGAAGAGLRWYAILCLPVLFAAGMALLDTIDGSFMNLAYGWAFSRPVRKVFYNLVDHRSVGGGGAGDRDHRVGRPPRPEAGRAGFGLGLARAREHQHPRFHHRGHVHRDVGARRCALAVRKDRAALERRPR